MKTTNEDVQPIKKVHGNAGKPSNGKNSPLIGNNGLRVEKGDNSKYTAIARDLISFPPINERDIDALKRRFEAYIDYCIEHDVKPGNLACYSALGITKQLAFDWERGVNGTPEHFDFIKKVKAFCSNIRELLMQDNKVNVITGIFWQKNYDGLVDKQEHVITPNLKNDNDYNADEIRARYLTTGNSNQLLEEKTDI